ncbi:hypothetical protein [uncultured Pontibacter sp.]|nr:hypothetical protein [uncultured Pontibacter sp.]
MEQVTLLYLKQPQLYLGQRPHHTRHERGRSRHNLTAGKAKLLT